MLNFGESKNLQQKQENMMNQSKYSSVGEKPPETHAANGRFRVYGIKIVLLYSNADK